MSRVVSSQVLPGIYLVLKLKGIHNYIELGRISLLYSLRKS